MPAYAASIHKSQGSEYPAVVIAVTTQHYAMLQRNLLYAGVTRGKRLVVLVGQKMAIAIRCATSRAGGAGRSWRNGSARTSRSVTSVHNVGRHRATTAVAGLFGEQESGEQVNCLVSSMHQACPPTPTLTYRCGAANRRFGPKGDIGVARALMSERPMLAFIPTAPSGLMRSAFW
jgi:hypothetical protein